MSNSPGQEINLVIPTEAGAAPSPLRSGGTPVFIPNRHQSSGAPSMTSFWSWVGRKPFTSPQSSPEPTRGNLWHHPIARTLQLLLILTAAITMLGANDTNTRFERVGHNMMCACSCGQILLECNHVGCPDSARMIDELHTQVATGANDRTIMDWFVAKYGAIILASPIRGGFDNVAWITPIALFLLAIVGTAVLVRIWHTRSLRTATATGSIKIPGLNRTEADTLRDRIRRETEY